MKMDDERMNNLKCMERSYNTVTINKHMGCYSFSHLISPLQITFKKEEYGGVRTSDITFHKYPLFPNQFLSPLPQTPYSAPRQDSASHQNLNGWS
ncbi:hypothetical protein I7I48_11011 [Histoplasma ohiense]|nr:hypothetical protein I7I48_11011 [Histoplasma ohiense (nom. inval.)]